MNDAELNRLLKSAAVPERPADYWDDFPERIAREVARTPAARAGTTRIRWGPRLAWALGVAVMCLLAGFWLGQRRGETTAANGLLQNPKVISEVLAVFPNRVRAIVQDESGLRLELADEADVPNSTPLWVRIREAGGSRSFVTFSGQQVEIGGQRLTVLAGRGGQVLVVGERFVWSSGETNSRPVGLEFEARALNLAAIR